MEHLVCLEHQVNLDGLECQEQAASLEHLAGLASQAPVVSLEHQVNLDGLVWDG